jgi:hypothetical protein
MKNASSRGMYPEAAYHIFPDMEDEISDRVRKKVENCDHFGGFLIFSTLNGGTSSGIGINVSRHIRQAYPDRQIQTFKLFPNTQISNPL